ncbi:hypothetical protein JQ595_31185 [Bradyrhizobium japonicum]|uniref:hypothetical protein n=1 Tax=Bradyrhizobium japonicum TaxID=375 RepID=UPI001BA9246D|nr:hypothetical protein [Bradyrhizobium japonicum]MBR0733224.1 hypothetical protein [Bradyrhizobium japonicum]
MSPRVLDKLTGRMDRFAKLARAIGITAVLAAINPTALFAQSAMSATPPQSSSLDVPTTKLLAIGTFTAKGTPERWKPLLHAEVRDTVRLYLAGKIDQWYIKQDQSGVVFVMSVTDPKEALELLGRFPFGQAGLMEFQIIPLGPIAPLRVLLTDPAK